jgi:aminoglycoside phosphotransferase
MKKRTISQAVYEICGRTKPCHDTQFTKNHQRRLEYERKMLHWYACNGMTHPAVRRKFNNFEIYR